MRLVALAAATLACGAAAQSSAADQPHPLKLKVGESLAICKTGTIQCPASSPICDDTTVVTAELSGNEGLVFKGLKPGTTLCSAGASSGFGARRVYRVTVVAP
jgi:hypothetical protein